MKRLIESIAAGLGITFLFLATSIFFALISIGTMVIALIGQLKSCDYYEAKERLKDDFFGVDNDMYGGM